MYREIRKWSLVGRYLVEVPVVHERLQQGPRVRFPLYCFQEPVQYNYSTAAMQKNYRGVYMVGKIVPPPQPSGRIISGCHLERKI
jgi:hypothetical protein